MKVVLLNPIGRIGGAERVLLSVLEALKMRFSDLQATVVTLTDGPLLNEAKQLGAQAICLNASAVVSALGESRSSWSSAYNSALSAPRVLALARRQRHLLESLSPDVVHSFGLKTHLLMGISRPRRTRVFWQAQDFYSARRVSRLFCPWAARDVDLVIADSSAVALDLKGFANHLPVTPIDNAIDTNRYTPLGCAVDLDNLAGVEPAAEGTVRVGLVGTYAKWKGHYAFLDAARRVRDCGSDTPVRFYIVGGPIYDTAGQFTVSELTDHSRTLGLRDCVAFVPFQSDTASVYRALDVVVHASTQPEPFGLVIAEAMACGRAVIVAAAGGAADLFTDGVDGLGHPPGDVEALAGAISRLVADSQLRKQMGERAVETATSRFGMERYADQLQAAYASVLGLP